MLLVQSVFIYTEYVCVRVCVKPIYRPPEKKLSKVRLYDGDKHRHVVQMTPERAIAIY